MQYPAKLLCFFVFKYKLRDKQFLVDVDPEGSLFLILNLRLIEAFTYFFEKAQGGGYFSIFSISLL